MGECVITENNKKRVRDDSEVNSVSSEAKKIRDDILDILDDSDTVPEIQDLDSVIKSFQEEIIDQAPAPEMGTGELGFLLEASDDELGLPPAASSGEEEVNKLVTNDFGFENEIPSYESLDFGCFNSDEFVTLGGSFDYCETEGCDFSEYLWRPESLPAL